MRRTIRDTLVDRLDGYERVVEVGIGRRTDVARALSEAGVAVTATDVRERSVPAGVAFVRDDVSAPSRAVYEGTGALYALNLPPELHRPTHRLARSVGAAFLFTTLGGDEPAIPVTRETVPGETIYRPKPERA